MSVSAGSVPTARVRQANQAPVNADGNYVLYWMTSTRRMRCNYALSHAVDWCLELQLPLLVFEPLRCDYDWASDRLHRFVIDGMGDNARACAASDIAYLPYVEPAKGSGKGLLAALAGPAAVVVSDEFPAFFLPRMLRAAAEKIAVRLETVDSNGLLPLRAADRLHLTAYSFRRFAQRQLPTALQQAPEADPCKRLGLLRRALPDLVPPEVATRWPAAFAEHRAATSLELVDLPIDHSVAPLAVRGGNTAARARLTEWIRDDLQAYADQRNQPLPDRTSKLSGHLHFGHLGPHEVLAELAAASDWETEDLGEERGGARDGFWNLGAADPFLDQLVTWREVGLNFCHHRDDYDRFESLPDWAQATLAQHAGDARPYTYTRDQFEQAATHSPIWNAAQNQLRREGRIHNYLRMLWEKKILHWSASPPEAVATMIALNDRYALDGRDPNSYSGIFWCLGRYDRPWGPERAVFGKVRYMTCANTARKLKLGPYLERYGDGSDHVLF